MARKTKRITWIPLIGKLRTTADGFIYEPTVAEPTPTVTQALPYTIAKSAIEFSAGSVALKTKLNAKDDRVQIILNHGLPNQIFLGFNAGGGYGIGVFRNGQWEPLAVAGTSDVLNLHHEYSMRIEVFGSSITLFIDGVEVCRANQIIQRAQVAVFVSGQSEIAVKEFRVDALKTKAFVVMQFTDEFNQLFNEVIRPVCEEYGFECVRGDDIYNNGLIIEDIARSIREASVIIADVTPNNPNVFYEVGYSHGLNKPTILLSDRKRDRLPFDVSGFRTLFYDNTIGGKSAVEERLRNHLKGIKA